MGLKKNDLAERVAAGTGWAQNKSINAVEDLLEIIKGVLGSGEDVLVSGFGKFCVKEKGARRGRNPATGTEMVLSARRVVTFKWSEQLRDRINEGK